MVSKPDYDNNFFTSPRTREELAELFRDPSNPLFNRATQSVNPPGSIFKIVTMITALESGKFNSRSTFVCDGRFREFEREEDWRNCNKPPPGHGKLDFSGALEQSCNVAFWKMSLELGSDNLSHYAGLLGAGHPTGIDLPEEASGQVPGKTLWEEEHKGSVWTPGDTCNLAIGQGRLEMTPLQVVTLFSQVVNGGYKVHTHLWSGLTPVLTEQDGIAVPKLRERIEGISAEHFNFVSSSLRRVVTDGIGWRVKMPELAVMGKTGTAQTGGGRPSHAWFVSAAPFPRPTFAMVVFLEYGGESANAVALSRSIYEKVLANLAIF
jgi:penicillin-binding protein 2